MAYVVSSFRQVPGGAVELRRNPAFLSHSSGTQLSLVAANIRTSSEHSGERVVSEASEFPTLTGNLRERVYLGTSGWSYASWKPEFYPQGLPQKKFLEYYAAQLNSVEVNYTFRQLPTQSMLSGWLAGVGPNFRFSFKAPQRLTHMLRLKDCSDAFAAFAHALAPVAAAGRMGVMLFQLPPNFKADPPRLDAFLAEAKTFGLRMAFEFRHITWFDDAVYHALRRHGAALCAAESDDLETPDVVTAPFVCYRFRKRSYSAEQLDQLERTLRQRSLDGEVFAYFKHEEQPTGANHAVSILRRLQES